MAELLPLLAMVSSVLVGAAWLVVAVDRKGSLAPILVVGSIVFVPVWLTPVVEPYVMPATLACIAVIAALALGFSWRPTWGDLAVGAGFLMVALSVLVGSSVPYVQGDLVLGAVPAYMAGRMMGERLGLAAIAPVIAVALAVAAVLGFVEALSGVNIFSFLKAGNAVYEEWAPLQTRAGISRVEGAFGHSIVFAVMMGVGIPFVAICRWRPWVRMAVSGLLIAATVPTLSRTGILCATLAFLLSMLVLGGDFPLRWRLGGLATLTATVAVVLPLVFSVFDAAGDEQEGSAEYRSTIFSLVARLQLLGVSPSRRASGSVVTWGGFKSIDNQLLLASLRYGWAPVVLFMAALVVLTWRVLNRQGNAAEVVLVALIPAYVTVAFITQLNSVVWLVAGLGVAEHARQRRRRSWSPPGPGGTQPPTSGQPARGATAHGEEASAGLVPPEPQRMIGTD